MCQYFFKPNWYNFGVRRWYREFNNNYHSSPLELSDKLDYVSENIGMTKSNLIRVAILKYLDVKQLDEFEEIKASSESNKRINLSLTELLYSIVKKQSDNLGVTVNSLIIYASEKIQKHYSYMLESLDQ